MTSELGGPPPRRFRGGLWLALAIVVVIVLAVTGIVPRMRAETALAKQTEQSSTAVVQVFAPRHGAPAEEIVLPGTIQAFAEAPIFARTSGYLKRWYADIGTRVKKGQLLAEIETPEVDRQLDQARADLATSTANSELSEITAARYVELLPSGARLVGLCPFHDDAVPSFTVYPDTNTYYCFGCGVHGDVITLIEEKESKTFAEALDYLERLAGLND